MMGRLIIPDIRVLVDRRKEVEQLEGKISDAE